MQGCLAWGQGDPQYSVSGVVVTAMGNVVPGALVSAWPLAEHGAGGSGHWVSANSEGKFTLSLTRGSYEIRAKDERDGYPDPSYLLCADSRAQFPRIIVEHRNIEDIRVSLGEQGGTPRILLRDGETKRPILRAKVTVRDAENAAAFVELSADNQGKIFFAAPHKLLIVTASAPGYREGSHGDEMLEPSDGRNTDLTFDLAHE